MSAVDSSICQYYLTKNGCRFGYSCHYKHPQIPSVWTLAVPAPNTCYYYELSQYFHIFLSYFTYPNYFQVNEFSILEINDFFAKFNGFDWSVILNESNVILNMNMNIWTLQLTKVILSILIILATHKQHQIKYWNEILNILCTQKVISSQYLTKCIIDNNNKLAKHLLSVYAKQIHNGKIPLLSYSKPKTFHTTQPMVMAPLIAPVALPSAMGICPISRFPDSKYNINAELFTKLPPRKIIIRFMMQCSNIFRLYPLKTRHFDGSTNVIELILQYVYQDYYCQLFRYEIDNFFDRNAIEQGFNNDLFDLLSQYIFDIKQMMKRGDRLFLINKDALHECIKSIDEINDDYFMEDKQVWKQYLLNHRCTKTQTFDDKLFYFSRYKN